MVYPFRLSRGNTLFLECMSYAFFFRNLVCGEAEGHDHLKLQREALGEYLN